MKNRRVSALAAMLTAFLLLVGGVTSVAAAGEYNIDYPVDISYNYSVYGEAVPAPSFCTYGGTLVEGLSKPSDLFLQGDTLYIADAGNSRILAVSAQTGETVREIRPTGENALSLTDMRGIFVTGDGTVYACLYDQKAIAVLAPDGTVERLLGVPDSPLLPEGFVYSPHRVAVQEDGRLYVVSEGTYQGMMQLDSEGNFLRFFGSNQVKADASTVLNLMWRKLFSEEMNDRLESNLPVDYSSVDLGADGFLYSSVTDEDTLELKKHGPDGSNIMRYASELAPGVLLGGDNYGDLETSQDGQTEVDTSFEDLAVTESGLIFALDVTRNRVFCYDVQSNLLGIFGTKTNQYAGFKAPVAIDATDDAVYVLDQGRGQVMSFTPTAYAKALFSAVSYYNEGLFTEAAPHWEEVRRHNSNLALCSAGLGWAALEKGDYSAAMDYFRAAQDKNGYNQAFLANRSQWFSDWAVLIFGVAALAIVGVFVLISVQSKKGAFDVSAKNRRHLSPTQVMFHPSVGFDAMKDERMGSNLYALLTLLALVIVRLLNIRYTGFLFNTYRPETINMPVEIIQIVLIFAAWVVCSWAVGTLVDSEARISEIFRASAYALCPYIVFQILAILASNILVLREGAFVSGLSAIGLYWSVLWMVISVQRTHKFTLGRTILFLVLVLVGVFFILFLCMMFYSLSGQFFTFLGTLYDEIQFRL